MQVVFPCGASRLSHRYSLICRLSSYVGGFRLSQKYNLLCRLPFRVGDSCLSQRYNLLCRFPSSARGPCLSQKYNLLCRLPFRVEALVYHRDIICNWHSSVCWFFFFSKFYWRCYVRLRCFNRVVRWVEIMRYYLPCFLLFYLCLLHTVKLWCLRCFALVLP